MHERLNSDELARFMLRAAGHPTAVHADLKAREGPRGYSRVLWGTHGYCGGTQSEHPKARADLKATWAGTEKGSTPTPRLRQVLWINQHQRGDYMRDQLMVGMRHLVGAHMVDWVKVCILYLCLCVSTGSRCAYYICVWVGRLGQGRSAPGLYIACAHLRSPRGRASIYTRL